MRKNRTQNRARKIEAASIEPKVALEVKKELNRLINEGTINPVKIDKETAKNSVLDAVGGLSKAVRMLSTIASKGQLESTKIERLIRGLSADLAKLTYNVGVSRSKVNASAVRASKDENMVMASKLIIQAEKLMDL